MKKFLKELIDEVLPQLVPAKDAAVPKVLQKK